MFRVTYSKRAFNKLSKLNKTGQIFIINWIEKNLVNCKNARLRGKALKGEYREYWRYRIGDYRLIADINDEKITILILSVGHRKDVYRK